MSRINPACTFDMTKARWESAMLAWARVRALGRNGPKPKRTIASTSIKFWNKTMNEEHCSCCVCIKELDLIA